MSEQSVERSPGTKLGLVILVGFLLSVPLFMVWLLVFDRQQQSEVAQASIAAGWGGPQVMSGPLLIIPYRTDVVETETENGSPVTRTRQVWQKLTLSPELSDIATQVRPEVRRRSIYEAVIYEAQISGRARFAMPEDLSRFGVAVSQMDLSRAELRFGLSDPRGLGANPQVSAGGRPLRLQPGGAQNGRASSPGSTSPASPASRSSSTIATRSAATAR
jgi:inner membrane protein